MPETETHPAKACGKFKINKQVLHLLLANLIIFDSLVVRSSLHEKSLHEGENSLRQSLLVASQAEREAGEEDARGGERGGQQQQPVRLEIAAVAQQLEQDREEACAAHRHCSHA